MYKNKSATKKYQRMWNMRIGENDNSRIVCRGHNQYIHTYLFVNSNPGTQAVIFFLPINVDKYFNILHIG